MPLKDLELYMGIALEEAAKAAMENEVPVGAVVVKDGVILSRAHNRCEQDKSMIEHAEFLAMKEAASKLDGRLTGCTLFVSLEPCAMCAGAAINYRLSSLVFGAYSEKTGCCGSVADLTDHWFLHTVETIGGIREKEASELLSRFFSTKRCKTPYFPL